MFAVALYYFCYSQAGVQGPRELNTGDTTLYSDAPLLLQIADKLPTHPDRGCVTF